MEEITDTTISNENLSEGTTMSCSLSPHSLDGVYRGARGTGRSGKDGSEPRWVQRCRLRSHGR